MGFSRPRRVSTTRILEFGDFCLITFRGIPANCQRGAPLPFHLAEGGTPTQRELREDAGYYLGGTMVNFTISLLIAMIARVLVAGF